MIRKTMMSGIIAMTLLALMTVTAMAKTDFSGTWVLDTSKSDGLPPGFSQTMTIKQSNDRLEVNIKTTVNGNDEEAKDTYLLDGKETDFTPLLGGRMKASNGKRASKWSDDGKSITSIEKSTIEGPNGTTELKATRHWELSADGKTLTVEMTMGMPNGERKLKRVYIKK